MNPRSVRARESRDSAEHPNSLGIVFALDVTGSMGSIPELLAREKLPHFMRTLSECGVGDSQVLFMAVGDATCDKAPFQVGQFETTGDLSMLAAALKKSGVARGIIRSTRAALKDYSAGRHR